ncbi:MAG TPA: alpha/beta hydrolase [Myxococcota bacterium]|nr:alpha/beta hydrolase [Myxococcota bacterium]HRY97124.1 alpha/beta hydrolase [Myxococcota bacterium]HSA21201.1 alpha/beta hydrolase [Myxococcota bacterium]
MRATLLAVCCLALAALGLAACAHAPPAATSPTSFRVEVAGHGRPVVLIPDLAVSGAAWDTTVAHLGGRVQTHALTLPGFAGQPPVEGPILPRVARELARYLRERGLQDVVVVGHMFGGAVAYSLAVDAPDLVGGLVVIDLLPCQSALGEPDEPRAQVLAEARETHAVLASRPPSVEQQERRLRSMVTDPALARQLAEQGSRSSARALADAFLELMQLDLRDAVRALRPPALIVVTDLTYPPEAWETILARWRLQIDPIPRHELVEVRDAHHYVMFDQPEAWFAALDRFLGIP